MIWGYPYFRKPQYTLIIGDTSIVVGLSKPISWGRLSLHPFCNPQLPRGATVSGAERRGGFTEGSDVGTVQGMISPSEADDFGDPMDGT